MKIILEGVECFRSFVFHS